MVIIDLHCVKPYVSFCLKTCVKFIDENFGQNVREKRSIIMHYGIASASPHVFEGWIMAAALISHFSSLQAPVTQLCYETWSTFTKKKCNDDKLEIIRLFHGLHVKQKIKSSNPFFGLFVSFLNCVFYLVFYMYHSMVIVSNLYFHVNFIS